MITGGGSACEAVRSEPVVADSVGCDSILFAPLAIML
jgi:hypothetical protein